MAVVGVITLCLVPIIPPTPVANKERPATPAQPENSHEPLYAAAESGLLPRQR